MNKYNLCEVANDIEHVILSCPKCGAFRIMIYGCIIMILNKTLWSAGNVIFGLRVLQTLDPGCEKNIIMRDWEQVAQIPSKPFVAKPATRIKSLQNKDQ